MSWTQKKYGGAREKVCLEHRDAGYTTSSQKRYPSRPPQHEKKERKKANEKNTPQIEEREKKTPWGG